jgi:hypothetical protein
MRPVSGTNSLHSRITSGVHRSAASEAWAEAGVALPAVNKTVSTVAKPQSDSRDCMSEDFFTLLPCSMGLDARQI